MRQTLLTVLGSGLLAALAGPALAKVTTYKPAAGDQPYPALFRTAPSQCAGGYWAKQRLFDRWGNVKGWSRPRFICP